MIELFEEIFEELLPSSLLSAYRFLFRAKWFLTVDSELLLSNKSDCLGNKCLQEGTMHHTFLVLGTYIHTLLICHFLCRPVANVSFDTLRSIPKTLPRSFFPVISRSMLSALKLHVHPASAVMVSQPRILVALKSAAINASAVLFSLILPTSLLVVWFITLEN